MLVLGYSSNAQLTDTQVVDSVDSPTKYYFKEFVDGTVFMKNGQQSQAKLNYQMQDQSILYIDGNGQRLVLSNIEEVDSVIVSGFAYVPVNGKFFEKLVNGSNQLLLSMYGKVKPHSTALNVTGSKNVSKNIESGDVSGAYVTRVQKRNSSLEFTNNFWLKQNDKLVRLKGIKQVINAYPNKRDAILNYENSNKTDFNDVESVSKLIVFCNS